MSTMSDEQLGRESVIDILVSELEMGVPLGTGDEIASRFGRNDGSWGRRARQEANHRYEESLAARLAEAQEKERAEREAEEIAQYEAEQERKREEKERQRALDEQRAKEEARIAHEEAQKENERKSVRWWNVLANFGTVSVLLISFVCSYTHIRDVCLSLGQPSLVAYLMPIAIDALLIVSLAKMKLLLKIGDDVSTWVQFGVLFGAFVSVVFNVASSADHGFGGMLVGAVPSAVLAISYEILLSRGKKKKTE